MKRSIRIAILVGSHAICVALGLAAATFVMRKALASGFNETVSLAFSSEHVQMQLKQGNLDLAKEAGLAHLRLLDDYQGRSPSWLLRAERALSLARLAVVEERRGQPDSARGYLDRATIACRAVPWKDCSAERLSKLATHGTTSP